MTDTSASRRLCFLDTTRLQQPLVDAVDVRTREDARIGRFDGVIVEPAERRVRYLVVDRGGRFIHHRYLMPLLPMRVDSDHHALRLEVDDVEADEWQAFDPRSFPAFSDDDLITAMFAQRS